VASGADRKTPKVVVRYEMYDERRSSNQEDARDLWERTREDAQNDSEAFGLLLSRIVVELQDIRATMSASVSRLQS
jgi:hypothetical protein